MCGKKAIDPYEDGKISHSGWEGQAMSPVAWCYSRMLGWDVPGQLPTCFKTALKPPSFKERSSEAGPHSHMRRPGPGEEDQLVRAHIMVPCFFTIEAQSPSYCQLKHYDVALWVWKCIDILNNSWLQPDLFNKQAVNFLANRSTWHPFTWTQLPHIFWSSHC